MDHKREEEILINKTKNLKSELIDLQKDINPKKDLSMQDFDLILEE